MRSTTSKITNQSSEAAPELEAEPKGSSLPLQVDSITPGYLYAKLHRAWHLYATTPGENEHVALLNCSENAEANAKFLVEAWNEKKGASVASKPGEPEEQMPLVCLHGTLLNFHCTKCKREGQGGNGRLVARSNWQKKYEACLIAYNELREGVAKPGESQPAKLCGESGSNLAYPEVESLGVSTRRGTQEPAGANEMEVRTVSCELTSFREGQHPIERGPWEKALIRLFSAYAPERYNGWREYGVDFENETFHVHVDYCDADCSCAYGVKEKHWLSQHNHGGDCFVSVCGGFVVEINKQHPLPHYDFIHVMDDVDAAEFIQFWHGGNGPTEEQKARKKLNEEKHEAERVAYFAISDIHKRLTKEAVTAEAKKRGIVLKYDPERCWRYECTCGHSTDHDAWQKEHDHVKPCEIWWMGQPNFLHKPTGYEVHWYKYPCRDGYGNQPKTRQQFNAIIRDCIKSLATSKPCAGEGPIPSGLSSETERVENKEHVDEKGLK